jgi:hypothetical protein
MIMMIGLESAFRHWNLFFRTHHASSGKAFAWSRICEMALRGIGLDLGILGLHCNILVNRPVLVEEQLSSVCIGLKGDFRMSRTSVLYGPFVTALHKKTIRVNQIK